MLELLLLLSPYSIGMIDYTAGIRDRDVPKYLHLRVGKEGTARYC